MTPNIIDASFRSERCREFPTVINLEVVRGKCPCRCHHCPVGITPIKERIDHFGMGEMSLQLFNKVVDEASSFPHCAIRFHAVGEPLLWPNLIEAAQYTLSKGVTSWLFTSTLGTTSKHLIRLCDAVSIIEVSLNSINKDDYRATKGIDAFNTVLRNIHLIRDRFNTTGKCNRLLASRVQSGNEVLDAQFIDYWKQTGLFDDVFIRTFHTYNNLLASPVSGATGAVHTPCAVHWARFNISVSGYAVVCFNELFKKQFEGSLILGDINRDSIQNVWSGEKLNQIRYSELTGDYGNSQVTRSLPCRECTSCQPLFVSHASESQLSRLEEITRC